MSPKIDYKEINKLLALMEEKNLTQVDLETEGFKIKISRNQSLPYPAVTSIAPQTIPETQANENIPVQEEEVLEKSNDFYLIKSPMVGTFYRASDPSSAPFVEIGDTVKKNQTLCIIEAMKLMNEIESEIDGILEEVYVENGKPVEYGQRLFAIQPLS